MTYKDKKEKLIKFREEVLKNYQVLYDKTLEYAKSSMADSKIVGEDIFGSKVASLIISLLYVEHPSNKEIINALREDIKRNKNGRTERTVEYTEIREEILKKYQELFLLSMQYGSSALELSNMRLLLSEAEDFRRFIESDVDSMKVTSLIAALMYVEYPTNPEIVTSLRRDMFINKHGRK